MKELLRPTYTKAIEDTRRQVKEHATRYRAFENWRPTDGTVYSSNAETKRNLLASAEMLFSVVRDACAALLPSLLEEEYPQVEILMASNRDPIVSYQRKRENVDFFRTDIRLSSALLPRLDNQRFERQRLTIGECPLTVALDIKQTIRGESCTTRLVMMPYELVTALPLLVRWMPIEHLSLSRVLEDERYHFVQWHERRPVFALEGVEVWMTNEAHEIVAPRFALSEDLTGADLQFSVEEEATMGFIISKPITIKEAP
jgi:hypothetical protein